MTSNTKIFLGLMAPLVAGAIFTSGMALQEARDAENAQRSWDGMLVMQGGTLVANPAALTPSELASATIINPIEHITVCTDRSGHAFVNPKDDECTDWKEIRHF